MRWRKGVGTTQDLALPTEGPDLQLSSIKKKQYVDGAHICIQQMVPQRSPNRYMQISDFIFQISGFSHQTPDFRLQATKPLTRIDAR